MVNKTAKRAATSDLFFFTHAFLSRALKAIRSCACWSCLCVCVFVCCCLCCFRLFSLSHRCCLGLFCVPSSFFLLMQRVLLENVSALVCIQIAIRALLLYTFTRSGFCLCIVCMCVDFGDSCVFVCRAFFSFFFRCNISFSESFTGN